jgi:hypothetical protein
VLPLASELGRWKVNELTTFHQISHLGEGVFLFRDGFQLIYKTLGKSFRKGEYAFRRAFVQGLTSDADEAGIPLGSYVIRRLKEAVEEEMFGEFPPAKINWFAVCKLCLDTIMALTERMFPKSQWIFRFGSVIH